MTAAADVAVFVARQRTERLKQGLPPTITDPTVLRSVAAVVVAGRRRKGVSDAA